MRNILRQCCVACARAKAPLYDCQCGTNYCMHYIKKHRAKCPDVQIPRLRKKLSGKTWPACISGDVRDYSVSNLSLKAMADRLDAISEALRYLLQNEANR